MYCGSVARARAISVRRRSPPDKRIAARVSHVRDAELFEQLFESLQPFASTQAHGFEHCEMFCAAVILRKTEGSCGR